MKKFFIIFVMLMGMASANAQEIVDISCGVAILENGMRVDVSRIPDGHLLRVGEDLGYSIQKAQALAAQKRRVDAMNAAYSDMYTGAYYGGGYGGAVVAPVVIGGGYESRGISVGNEHWGFSTNSTKCGAYKSGSTNVRVGGFHIGTYNSGISKAAKKAAATNMKNSVATSASTRSTSYNNVKEVNINDLMRFCK